MRNLSSIKNNLSKIIILAILCSLTVCVVVMDFFVPSDIFSIYTVQEESGVFDEKYLGIQSEFLLQFNNENVPAIDLNKMALSSKKELFFTKKELDYYNSIDTEVFEITDSESIPNKDLRRLKTEIKKSLKKHQPSVLRDYIILKRDTIGSIARKNNIDIDSIIGANDLYYGQPLVPGKKLKIPSKKGVYHKVKKGQSIWDVAKTYRIPIKNIILENNLEDDAKIYLNQLIFVPGAKPIVRNYPGKTDGKFLRPVRGFVTSNFGWRIRPITRQREFHCGVDICAPQGTPIYAAQSGRVSYAGWISGYGKLIELIHKNNNKTRYAHCYQFAVKPGQFVEKGQIIAYVGDTGFSTGPHCHFEVIFNNTYKNPLQMIR